MRERRVSVLLFAALFFSLLSVPAAGADSGFHPEFSKIQGRGGEAVELSIPYSGSQGDIGAFAVEVAYPTESFTYVRAAASSIIRDGYSFTKEEDGLIRSVYVMEQPSLLGQSDTFTYHFQIQENAEPGDNLFSVSVYQVLSPDSESLLGAEERLTFSVLPPLSNEAFLWSLMPDNGALEPEFSPDCFAYTVTVPFSVTSMTFSAEPVEGAVCKVNRKNLGAGGSDTPFVVTVTAEDGKTKTEYHVTVHREEKAPVSQAEVTPKPDKTASPQKDTSSAEKQTVSEQSNTTSAPVPTATPKPAASSKTAAVTTQSHAAETAAAQTVTRPSVTVRSGDSRVLPVVLTVMCFVFACVVLRPLSKWLVKTEKQEQPDNSETSEEDEKDSEEK